MTIVSKAIKALREEQGLSIGQLAKRAGVSRAYLWQLENGSKKRPTLELLQRIANALGADVTELYTTHATPPETANEDLPPGLKEFVTKRGKALGVKKGDIENMKAVQFRGKQAEHPEDWEYLYLFLKRWAQ